MKYFRQYPLINYNNQISKDILLKAAVVKNVFDKIDAYYTYIIPENYRADMVANEVYGNPYYDWIVYLCNDIIDPYYGWPLEYDKFKSYLEAKYNTDVYTLQSQIHHYKYVGITDEDPKQIALKTWTMTPETHAIAAAANAESVTGWAPVYTYHYEDELNDSKRSIRLISDVYLPQINKEFAEIFK